MTNKFRISDQVSWKSEAGQVSGTLKKVHTHRASSDDPQYEIKSDQTDHVAIHKGDALKKSSSK